MKRSIQLTVGMCCFAILAFLTVAGRGEDEVKSTYKVKIETVKAQPTVSIRFTSEPDKLSEKYGGAFGAIVGYVTSAGGTIAGAPYGRYHSMTDATLDIEAGMPVAEAMGGRGKIKATELPGGKVATTVHKGPYEKLGQAHEALNKWVKDHGYTITGGPWESYVTDPGQESDPRKWQTKLFLPVAKKDAAKSE